MKIKHRVMATLGFMVLLMAAITAYGQYTTDLAIRLLIDVSLKGVREQALITSIANEMEKNRAQIPLALLHDPKFNVNKGHPPEVHYKAIAENTKEIQRLWAAYQKTITDPTEKQLADQWYVQSGELGLRNVGSAVERMQSGKWDDALSIMLGQLGKDYQNSDKASKALKTYSDSLIEQVNAGVLDDIRMATYILLAIAGLGGVFAILASISLIRRLIAPLEKAVDLADHVAAGDLTQTVHVTSQDEIGQLMQACRAMNENLENVIHRVRMESSVIASASSQIASGNLDLSARTEAQSSALQETVILMTSILQTVRDNNQGAEEANALASSAASVANQSGKMMSSVVDTMNTIEHSADRITDIIGVINDIAFQTNILALNASVEAARAGEQGRGFAVVASEVRNLAQRSAGSAREINNLINESVQQIRSGSVLVNHSMETINELVTSIRRVYDQLTQISSGTREQVLGIEQINQAIAEIDVMTQQNASLAEEATTATQVLSENANALMQAVSVFKTKDTIYKTSAQYT